MLRLNQTTPEAEIASRFRNQPIHEVLNTYVSLKYVVFENVKHLVSLHNNVKLQTLDHVYRSDHRGLQDGLMPATGKTFKKYFKHDKNKR